MDTPIEYPFDLNEITEVGTYKPNCNPVQPKASFYITLGDIVKYKETGDITMMKVINATGEATLCSFLDEVKLLGYQ